MIVIGSGAALPESGPLLSRQERDAIDRYRVNVADHIERGYNRYRVSKFELMVPIPLRLTTPPAASALVAGNDEVIVNSFRCEVTFGHTIVGQPFLKFEVPDESEREALRKIFGVYPL